MPANIRSIAALWHLRQRRNAAIVCREEPHECDWSPVDQPATGDRCAIPGVVVFCPRGRSAHAVSSSRNGGRGRSSRTHVELRGDRFAVRVVVKARVWVMPMQRRIPIAFLPPARGQRSPAPAPWSRGAALR